MPKFCSICVHYAILSVSHNNGSTKIVNYSDRKIQTKHVLVIV